MTDFLAELAALAKKATQGHTHHNGGGTTFVQVGDNMPVRIARFDDFNDAELHQKLLANLPAILALGRERDARDRFWHKIGYATAYADAALGKLPQAGALNAAIAHAWEIRHETYEGDLDADAALEGGNQ